LEEARDYYENNKANKVEIKRFWEFVEMEFAIMHFFLQLSLIREPANVRSNASSYSVRANERSYKDSDVVLAEAAENEER
jgi:hypothetical protein